MLITRFSFTFDLSAIIISERQRDCNKFDNIFYRFKHAVPNARNRSSCISATRTSPRSRASLAAVAIQTTLGGTEL